MSALRVEHAEPLVIVCDAGRRGLAHLGVTEGGAADRTSFRAANALVGNPADAAALEVLLGGWAARAEAAVLVAVTGAVVEVCVDGAPRPMDEPFPVEAGQRITLSRPHLGLRTYVAVAGGFDVPVVLGSRSTDLVAGLGPPVLRAGDVLGVGEARELKGVPGVGTAAAPSGRLLPGGRAAPLLRARWGPRHEWFTDEARHRFATETWTVSGDTNRVACRLEGPVLTRARAGELRSEPVVTGGVQVPSSGRPLVFGVDHPVTGGYPVIAVLDDAAVDTVAQLRPGSEVRFDPR